MNSKKLMALSIEELESQLTTAKAKLELARDAYSKAQKAMFTADDKYRALSNEDMRRKLYDNTDITLILQAYPDTKVGYDRYVLLMREHGLHHGGIWLSTGQRAVTVTFNKQDCEENTKQINGLKILLPHILPIMEVDDDREAIKGCKPVGIFEHTLSEDGVYKFYVRPDNTVILELTRYNRVKYKEIGDLDSAMKYIQRHHWYTNGDDWEVNYAGADWYD